MSGHATHNTRASDAKREAARIFIETDGDLSGAGGEKSETTRAKAETTRANVDERPN